MKETKKRPTVSAKKHTGCVKKSGNGTAQRLAAQHADSSKELDDIFGAIQGKKRNITIPVTSKATSKVSTTPESAGPKHSTTGSKDTVVSMYRVPEKSMGMSDEAFFGKSDASSVTPSTAAVAGEQAFLKEGVHRIVSMSELQKMLSTNPDAGSTPNCPFDCNCCF